MRGSGETGSHFPSAPLAANGQLRRCTQLKQQRVACRRPCSRQTASVLCSYLCRGRPVSLWRGESHSPSLLSANTPTAVAEVWTVTAHHQLDLQTARHSQGPLQLDLQGQGQAQFIAMAPQLWDSPQLQRPLTLDLRLYQTQHSPKLASSTSPQKR